MAKPIRKTYFVQRPDVTSISTVRVEEENGRRIVRMTEAEAQYYLDQGVIGNEPPKTESDGGLMRKPTDEEKGGNISRKPSPADAAPGAARKPFRAAATSAEALDLNRDKK